MQHKNKARAVAVAISVCKGNAKCPREEVITEECWPLRTTDPLLQGELSLSGKIPFMNLI